MVLPHPTLFFRFIIKPNSIQNINFLTYPSDPNTPNRWVMACLIPLISTCNFSTWERRFWNHNWISKVDNPIVSLSKRLWTLLGFEISWKDFSISEICQLSRCSFGGEPEVVVESNRCLFCGRRAQSWPLTQVLFSVVVSKLLSISTSFSYSYNKDLNSDISLWNNF